MGPLLDNLYPGQEIEHHTISLNNWHFLENILWQTKLILGTTRDGNFSSTLGPWDYLKGRWQNFRAKGLKGEFNPFNLGPIGQVKGA